MKGLLVTLVATAVILGAIGSASAQAPPMPSTYCWPQPIFFPEFRFLERAERRLHFVIIGEQTNAIILESIRVNDRLRPDAEDIVVDGDSVAFSCDFMKFLGTSDFRPITGDFDVPYTIAYDKTTGEHVTLTGTFDLDFWDAAEKTSLTAETPTLYCWPQPTILVLARHRPDDPSERILNFVVQGEQVDKVILESIRVQERIIPDEVRVDGDSIVFACRVLRFMGVSDLMPFVGDDETEYIVEYDKVEGKHIVLTDLYKVYWMPPGRDLELAGDGDLNLDGTVDLADVHFVAEYFFNNGPKCEDETRMDIDGNGRIDLQDLRKLISIVGM